MDKKYKLLFLFCAVTVAVWFFVFLKDTGGILEADFLDIGQGDAILIKTPRDQTMLIDGGPSNRILEKLGKYLPPFSKKIDIILLTHPHADHVTGLVEVLKRYGIGALILSGADLKTDVYGELLKISREKNIPVVVAEAGEAIHFGDDLEFDILSPPNSSGMVFGGKSEGFGSAGNDVNDTSIIGKLIFSAKGGSASGGNDFSILFTGDATLKIENKLSVYGNSLKSDILKVGHHGSKYSSSLSFLESVSPKAAIIEVGAKNFYGHPSQAALNRLKMVGADIFRTDLNGDIRVLSNGFTTNIYKEK